MRKLSVALFLSAAISLVQPAMAQDEENLVAIESAPVIEEVTLESLPADLREAIRGSELVEILSVNGVERVSGNIVRVDELILQPGSVIEFQDMDQPYLAVVAERVRVVDPNAPIVIRRSESWSTAHGSDGEAGVDRTRAGRSGRHGNNGQHGGRGIDGAEGATFDMPPFFLVVGQLEHASGSAPIEEIDISYSFDGLPGPNGGAGGRGGHGGQGGGGRNWRSGDFGTCRAGPGRGGNGGNGGRGGDGANSGRGGNGSNVAFVGPRDVVDVLTLGTILNYGAAPGIEGASGTGGNRGDRGGAGNSGNCDRASNGSRGNPGPRGNSGIRSEDFGERGSVFALRHDNVEELFAPVPAE